MSGDQGGNLFIVHKLTGGKTPLHTYWDDLLALFPTL